MKGGDGEFTVYVNTCLKGGLGGLKVRPSMKVSKLKEMVCWGLRKGKGIEI